MTLEGTKAQERNGQPIGETRWSGANLLVEQGPESDDGQGGGAALAESTLSPGGSQPEA